MRRLLGAALAMLATASPAVGQSGTGSAPDLLPAHTSHRTPLLSLGGGLATPSGPDGANSGRGFQAGATGVFPVAGRLGIEIQAS